MRSEAINDEAAEDSAPLVVALGGNAISRAGDKPSVAAQFERMRATVDHLLPVIASGDRRMVITHGNGPQVGNILLRSDLAAEAGELPRLPIDSAVADTQGAMGYMIQQCLANALWESGIQIPVATVITQVLVDDDDPAFDDPTKPIGRFYPQEEVSELRKHGWAMKKDTQGRGWRRVIASPQPREILEQPVIEELVRAGVLVIACGGGGIPVVSDTSGALKGAEAVIDKDSASALLASGLGASTFAVLTEVDRVSLRFGKPDEEALDEVSAASLGHFDSEGHFPPGSMGPKVRAVISFIEGGGKRAIITSPECFEKALAGRAGTHVVDEISDDSVDA
ncbi:MAG: carbamate kinase [Actinobacteria bacterium]|nr:carbamate kinase [Actinomycetota bacterium]